MSLEKHPPKKLKQATLSWVILLTSLAVLLLLSWQGALDRMATFDVDHSLAQAGLMYGTARGINALISMLQTTDVSVLLVSMEVGQILDPINDLIERFSDIMTVAIAALALQKILVIITAHTIFKIILSILAVGIIVSKLLRMPALFTFLFKSFMLLIFVRLAFAMIVLLNFSVDSVFLSQPTAKSYQTMQHYQQRLSHTETVLKSTPESSGILGWVKHKQDQLDIKKQITSLSQGISNFAHQTLMLMTLLILKSILLPLLFWWMLVQGFKALWRSPKLKQRYLARYF